MKLIFLVVFFYFPVPYGIIIINIRLYPILFLLKIFLYQNFLYFCFNTFGDANYKYIAPVLCRRPF